MGTSSAGLRLSGTQRKSEVSVVIKIGDIWQAWAALGIPRPGDGLLIRPWVVVPTNVGWKRSGEAVMGVGIALAAVQRDRDLARRYGAHCELLHGQGLNPEDIFIFASNSSGCRFICAPSKPLDAENPNLSWRGPGSISLVERSLRQIADNLIVREGPILMPLIGCGEGGLSPHLVAGKIRRVFQGDQRVQLYVEPSIALLMGLISEDRYYSEFKEEAAKVADRRRDYKSRREENQALKALPIEPGDRPVVRRKFVVDDLRKRSRE
jgi:hypothetical protein